MRAGSFLLPVFEKKLKIMKCFKKHERSDKDVERPTDSEKADIYSVYFYNLDTIKSLDELGVWFVGVSSISDLTIRRIQLIDSSDKNAERAGSTEIDIAIARNNLANCIREVHADTVSISTFYKGVSIVIGVDCNDWRLSIVANKKDKDTLDALENLLTTINKNYLLSRMSYSRLRQIHN